MEEMDEDNPEFSSVLTRAGRDFFTGYWTIAHELYQLFPNEPGMQSGRTIFTIGY